MVFLALILALELVLLPDSLSRAPNTYMGLGVFITSSPFKLRLFSILILSSFFFSPGTSYILQSSFPLPSSPVSNLLLNLPMKSCLKLSFYNLMEK